jgi:hypothetical protein
MPTDSGQGDSAPLLPDSANFMLTVTDVDGNGQYWAVKDRQEANFIAAHFDPATHDCRIFPIESDAAGNIVPSDPIAVEPSPRLRLVDIMTSSVMPREPHELSDELCPRCQDHQLHRDPAFDPVGRADGQRICLPCGWFEDLAAA